MKKFFVARRFFVFVLVSFAFLFSPIVSNAIEYGMLGGKPTNPDPQVKNSVSWFIYNLGSGEFKEDSITVMNLFDQTMDVLVYAADTTKSSGGGFALEQLSEPKDEVGSWVRFYPNNPPDKFQSIYESGEKKITELCKLTKEDIQNIFKENEKDFADSDFSELEQWCQGKDLVEIQMQSNEQLVIPFVIRIPDNADVGEHTGGILIQKKAPDDAGNSGGSAVKLTTRIGVRIYETVPGKIIKKISLKNFKLEKNFKEFSFSDWFGETKKQREYLVETEIFNDGNTSILHDNNVYITDVFFGKRTEKIERNFQVLKSDKFIANYSWKKPLFGYYKFQGEVAYQGNNGEEVLKTESLSLWIIPWREMVLFALAAFLVFLTYWIWKRNYKKKYGGIGWVSYCVASGETISQLAEKYGIDWRVLAKTNKLEAPYLLNASQVILVPPIEGSGEGHDEVNDIIVGGDGVEKTEEENGVGELNEGEISIDEILKKNYSEKNGENNFQSIEAESAMKEKVCLSESAVKRNMFFGKSKWLIILTVVFVAIVGVAIMLLMQRKNRVETISAEISVDSIANATSTTEEKTVELVEEKKDAVMEENKKEEEVMEEEVDISQINIRVFNEGAPAGSAGKVKDMLISEGYAKSEASNGESKNFSGSVVVFGDDKFQKNAQLIVEALSKENIKAEVRVADTDEERSADIVIILGK